jgi:hypothetical protein
MKRFSATSIIVSSLMLLSVPSSSYAQTTIVSLPFTISVPGTYVFTTNLTYSQTSGNAITVNVSNVTIDLNGYYLSCPILSNGARAIYSYNKANIRVKNGEIVGFGAGGVEIDYLASGTNVNFGHLVEDIRFYHNYSGVEFEGSRGCVVKNCQFIDEAMGVAFFSGTGNRAVQNVATGAVLSGFFSDGTDYFDSNYADSCQTGINASPTTKLRFNTTTNCTTGVQGGISELANDQ